MAIKNIDLVYSGDGQRMYPGTNHSFIINQYATNYKIRVGFYDPDMELNIASVKAVVYNGRQNPARVLYKTENGLYIDKVLKLYTYQLTQYDTQLYAENIEISVNITMKDGTEYTDTISIPMEKQYFGKITPQPLENDGTLNSVIVGTTHMQEQIDNIIAGNPVRLDMYVLTTTGTLKLSDYITDKYIVEIEAYPPGANIAYGLKFSSAASEVYRKVTIVSDSSALYGTMCFAEDLTGTVTYKSITSSTKLYANTNTTLVKVTRNAISSSTTL